MHKYWLHSAHPVIMCTKRGIKWPTQSSRNDKRYKKHSGTTSHELVFSTCSSHPSEKRKKRRRVHSAQRERKTNKLRTVTRSVNLKQHVTPDPAELFGFSLENSQREHLTYGFFILLLQDVVVIRVFLRGLSAIIHGDHGEVGGHFLTMWGVCLSPYLSVSPSASPPLRWLVWVVVRSSQLCSYLFDTGSTMWPACLHIRKQESPAPWAVLTGAAVSFLACGSVNLHRHNKTPDKGSYWLRTSSRNFLPGQQGYYHLIKLKPLKPDLLYLK